MIKKIILFCLSISILDYSNIYSSEKIYIDMENVDNSQDKFRIHTGHNVWIETDTIHRDRTGFYTFNNNICRSMCLESTRMEYQKTWKCPYCYQFWPIKTPCQNQECPSRY